LRERLKLGYPFLRQLEGYSSAILVIDTSQGVRLRLREIGCDEIGREGNEWERKIGEVVKDAPMP